ncbi:hypothetical protein HDU87_002193 [Geranomyces variabilis]|uniref:GRAM domain-containing protein n=1 Tax=Geranomyces variabilis TaxID=109894 RepID=A0AAD5TNE4_9FUNG|nr:hypothetical protein HDU87_002193 [Geranomyces variabilis]
MTVTTTSAATAQPVRASSVSQRRLSTTPRRQLSRDKSATSIRQNVVAAAHAVYVAGHNAKERVKHALPIVRRNTGDSISSSSSTTSSGNASGGGGGVYPTNALSDTEEQRPNSWPRVTPRAPRIGADTSSPPALSSSFSMSDCNSSNNTRRSRVSTRDIRKFIKAFPSTTSSLSSVIDETLEAAYPCALSRSPDNTLWHGQLFLTTHRLLFAGVGGALFTQQFTLEVEYADVLSVEKTATGAILPNALSIVVGGESPRELLFAAFVGRDAAFCDLMIMMRRRRREMDEGSGRRPLRVTFKVDEPAAVTMDAYPHVDLRLGGVAQDEVRDHQAEAPPISDDGNEDDTLSSSRKHLPPSPVSTAPPVIPSATMTNPPSDPSAPPPPLPPQSTPITTLKHLLPRNFTLPIQPFSPTRDQIALASILISLAIILMLGLVTAAVNVSRLAALTQRIDRAAALAAAAASAAASGGRIS